MLKLQIDSTGGAMSKLVGELN